MNQSNDQSGTGHNNPYGLDRYHSGYSDTPIAGSSRTTENRSNQNPETPLRSWDFRSPPSSSAASSDVFSTSFGTLSVGTKRPREKYAAYASSGSSSANANPATSTPMREVDAAILNKLAPFAYFDKHASVCYVSKQSLVTDYDRQPFYSLTSDSAIVVAQGQGIFRFYDSVGYPISVSAAFVPQAAHSDHQRSHAVAVSPAVLLASEYRYTSYSQCHSQLSHPKHGSVWIFFVRGMHLMPIKPPANIDKIGETWCQRSKAYVWLVNPIGRPLPPLVADGNRTNRERSLALVNLQLHRLFAHADPVRIYLTLKLILNCAVEWDDIQPVACAECNEFRTAPYEPYRYHCPLKSTLTIYVDVCDLTTQMKSDPSSLVFNTAVCFENRDTGLYYVSGYRRRYEVLPAFRMFLEQCSHTSSFSNIRVIFSPRAKGRFTFLREDVRDWHKERRRPSFLRVYINLERNDHSSGSEEFNASCWQASVPGGHTLTVETENSPPNGPRLGQLIEQMSQKLLKSSGLLQRFALYAAVHFVDTHNMMYDPRSDHQFCSPYTLYTSNPSIAACFQTFGCLVSYRELAPDRCHRFARPGKWGLYIGLRGDRYHVVDLKTQEIGHYPDVEFYPTITPLTHEFPGWKKYPHDDLATVMESHIAVDTSMASIRPGTILRKDATHPQSGFIANLGDSVAKADSVPSMVFSRGMASSLTEFTTQCVFGVPRYDKGARVIREIAGSIPYTIWRQDSRPSQPKRQKTNPLPRRR